METVTIQAAQVNTSRNKNKGCCCGCCGNYLFVIIVIILLYLFRAPILRTAGRWLDISGGAPGHADIIYVYAGGEKERPRHACELFHEGLAPVVMTAGSMKSDKLLALGIRMTDSQVNERALIRCGVPKSRIIRVNRGTSTWEETAELRRVMKRRGLKSAILVTSNFHTRRVRMTVKKQFKKDRMNFQYAAPHRRPVTHLDNWWKTEEDLITVQNEYIKLLYYLKTYII